MDAPRRRKKPNGQGRRFKQKEARRSKAEALAVKFLRSLNLEEVEKTETLFSRGTLKRKKNRQAFDWVHSDPSCKGRVFTKKLWRGVVKCMLSNCLSRSMRLQGSRGQRG